MTQKDDWTETLHRKEKADEDRYFAAQDRVLIEKLQRQRQQPQQAEPHEAAPEIPADKAPPDSDSTAEKTILELEYIIDQLSDFYEPQEARLWLFSRQKLLNSEKPAELIQQGRTGEVRAVINQLREGVFI